MNPSAHEILRSLYTERKAKNSAYSTRAFARDIGMSQTLLSLVLNGKRPLSIKQAVQIGILLKLPRSQSEKLVALTLPSGIRTAPRTTTHHRDLDIERFKVISQWYHLPLLDLTTTRHFRSDKKWIAQRLGISVVEVTDAIDRLETLGLLETKKGQWRKTTAQIYFPTQKSEAAVRSFHKQMIQKSLNALEKTAASDFAIRDISAMTMAIPQAKIGLAKKLIQEFQKSLASTLNEDNEGADSVYQLNMQFIPLTQELP